jgi:hypothetical protein
MIIHKLVPRYDTPEVHLWGYREGTIYKSTGHVCNSWNIKIHDYSGPKTILAEHVWAKTKC